MEADTEELLALEKENKKKKEKDLGQTVCLPVVKLVEWKEKIL